MTRGQSKHYVSICRYSLYLGMLIVASMRRVRWEEEYL